jgi:hypothetical protein
MRGRKAERVEAVRSRREQRIDSAPAADRALYSWAVGSEALSARGIGRLSRDPQAVSEGGRAIAHRSPVYTTLPAPEDGAIV